MPEVRFTVRWPDSSLEECYSPSTAIKSHLSAGETYPLSEFHKRAREGLLSASERVKQIYGRPCSLALGQLAQIEAKVTNFETDDDATVTCISMTA